MTHAAASVRVIAETSRLRIRHKQLSDAPDDYRWRRDPDVARFDAAAPTTLPYHRFLAQLEREIAFESPSRQVFGIDTLEGEHIGNVMYYNADASRGTAEFGISIGSPPHRGLGLGTGATVAFLRYLWRERPYAVVHLHTLEWNARAQRSFQHAGFCEVGRVRRGESNFIRMEAERDEWLTRDAEGRFAQHA